MIIYPAIDLKGGQCVRLRQGDFAQTTVYSSDPVNMALHWQAQGAEYLHVVDLDGALAGTGVNTEVIRRICTALTIPVQTGGGIRIMADVEEKLAAGVSRVIIGTAAVKDPEFLRQAIETYGPDRIVAGIDAKNGMVALEGWEEESQVSAVELGKQMRALGLQTAVYTDISRDGMLSGCNVAETKKMMEQTGLDIIASGGISSIEDMQKVAEAGIPGVITGKAIYEGKLDLAAAIQYFKESSI